MFKNKNEPVKVCFKPFNLHFDSNHFRKLIVRVRSLEKVKVRML